MKKMLQISDFTVNHYEVEADLPNEWFDKIGHIKPEYRDNMSEVMIDYYRHKSSYNTSDYLGTTVWDMDERMYIHDSTTF